MAKMNYGKRFLCDLNMTLGYIPILVTMLLCEFIPQQSAIYIGTIASVAYTGAHYYLCKPYMVNYFLLSATIVLTLFSISTLTMRAGRSWPQNMFPFILEVAAVVPLLVLYMNKAKYLSRYADKRNIQDAKNYLEMARFTIAGIHVILILSTVHFVLITLGLLFTQSLDNRIMWSLLHIAPPLIFIMGIYFSHMGIIALREKQFELIPIVDLKGQVVGKVDKAEVPEYKSSYINPIIRTAIVNQGMLFLCNRPETRLIDKGKMDIPLETYLLFQEDLEEGLSRLLKESFPDVWESLVPTFSIKHQFRNEKTHRLVYLFILDLGGDDELLNNAKFHTGKLWSLQQIEQNLGHHYFSELFEYEYEHLKHIIGIREKYKES